jgi:hypothetical protein
MVEDGGLLRARWPRVEAGVACLLGFVFMFFHVMLLSG